MMKTAIGTQGTHDQTLTRIEGKRQGLGGLDEPPKRQTPPILEEPKALSTT